MPTCSSPNTIKSPGWGTTQTDDGVSFQIYPPDKTCSVVASYLKNAQLAGRSTSDMATEIGAKAGLGQFADAGPAVISGVKGEAFSATQPDPSGGGLWIVRLIFVPLEPGLWAGEFVKWPQSATPAQQAACNAGAEAVTLIKH